MTPEFDPYRKWLGIPQAELPPNHYRLLGIANFEDDPDVIENAADRSMAHIQTFKTGKHSDLTQRLLNELSAAKLCLLDPAKKSAYDARLRNQISASPARPLPVATTVPPQTQPLGPFQPQASAPQSVPDAMFAQNASTTPQPVVFASNSGSRSTWGKRKRKKDIILYAVSLGVALILVAGAVMVLGPSNSSKDSEPNSETAKSNAQNSGKNPHPPVGIASKKDDNPKPSDEGKPAGSSPFQQVPNTSDPENAVEVPGPLTETPIVPAESGNEDKKELTLIWKRSPFSKRVKLESLDLGNEVGLGNFDTDAIIETGDKPAPPNNEDYEKAVNEVREALQSEFDAAVTPAKKLALAQQMYDIALKESAVATRFALLTSAHDLALASSHVNSSMRVADAISKLFETDGNEFHARLLERASRGASKDTADYVTTATLLLVERSVRAGEFELAQRLVDQAKSGAKIGTNPLLTHAAEAMAEELPGLATQYREAQSAIATLLQTPDDPLANERVGRFMCFELGDWDQGLPLLSRVNDPALKAAAQSDLASPLDPLERVKTGDLWWELSEKSTGTTRLALRDRAVYWYERTAGQLSGLTKERIAHRINSVREEAKMEALAELPASARELVGQYIVRSVNHKSNQTTYSVWELRDDLTATADGTAVAQWEATGSSGFKLMFLDSPQSPVYLRFQGPKVPLKGARTLNGVTWSLEFARLTVVAVWEHKTESVKSRFGPDIPGDNETLTFYSNGRVNDPLGQIAWLLQGRNLAIDWGKGKKTVAVLSPDGTSYTGKTTLPTGFGRTTISADVNGRLISSSQ